MRSLILAIIAACLLTGCAYIKKPGSDVSFAYVSEYNKILRQIHEIEVKDTSKPLGVSEAVQVKNLIMPNIPGWPSQTVSTNVAVYIDKNGKVFGGHIIKTNDARYNSITMSTIMRWQFEPPKFVEGVDKIQVELPFCFPSRADSEADMKAKCN